jgi:hypothetical protein
MTLPNGLRWTAVALVAGATFATVIWQLDPMGFSGKTANQRTAVSNEGDRREEVLGHLTKIYVLRGQGVSERMRAGLELAPTAFLNAELERQGVKWRVRVTDGLTAESFDIS